MMVSITLFGGVGQIGGNKVLLEDGDTRIFFDFGEPFGMKDKYFVDFLMPRERFGLRDYFHFDMLPRISGLYDQKWLEETDLKHTDPGFNAIFVSHMHYDHVMHMRFVDEGIPAYLGFAADIIRRSWAETSLGKMNFGDREYHTFRTGDKIKVGSIEVHPIHVDHSTPGAYGFLIHTSEGCVVYTGDFRMHGPRSDMTVDFMKAAAEAKPVAMICEGTRVMQEDLRENLSEDGVKEKVLGLANKAKDLAIVSFYPKDLDRMRTFRDIATETGRKFVVSAKVANLLEMFQSDPGIDAPDPMNDPNMLVYVRKMARPDKVRYEKKYVDMLGSSDHVVDSEYVRNNQSKLLFHTDFFQLTELIDIKPKGESLFIRSKSEPFEEDDVQEEVLQNWISWYKLDFRQAHASGHADMNEVLAAIDEISPEAVIPIHTEHPSLFKRSKVKVIIPEAGKPLSISE
ncbi:MAG: hypothetical protein KKE24_08275 [Candidatus Thermoplasmatota archaeon]|nr:hypothetical protein [Candidatus Thermoplasmatota archaeon]